MGTMAYMSPEQIRNEPVDARSDIYSLSVTLFEMLTGRLPFVAGSDFELMSAHLQTPPPRLSRFCAEIAKSLENAVLRGLEKKPAARFQTAEEFGAALEHAEAPAHRFPPVVPRQPRKPRRHRQPPTASEASAASCFIPRSRFRLRHAPS